MRFGLIHRIMTDALASLGVLAVISTAQLSPWTSIALLVGLAFAIAIPESWQNRPALRHFATIAPLTLFIIQGGRLLASSPPLDVAVEFAALLQIVRLATRRGAAHDQQIIVLALLHFVAGTVLGGGITYGICFIGFLIVAPGALVLSHLRREVEGNYRQGARDRTGLPVDVPRILRSRRVVGRGFLAATCMLALPILIFTSLLFILFPRVGLSLLLLNHPSKGKMVGFSDKVDLGEVGVLRSDPSIALRFEVEGLPDPPPTRLTLRLRGTAFDDYDGRAWKRTERERRQPDHSVRGTVVYPLLRPPDDGNYRKISFDLEPIDPPVVFIPQRSGPPLNLGPAVAVVVQPQSQALLSDRLVLNRGPEGEIRYSGSDTRGLRYEVYAADEHEGFAEELTPQDLQRYTTTPPTLPDRVITLAHTWTDSLATTEQKAHAIEDHLRREFKYDLGSPSGGKPQPVDHFLFESKAGHCEFFSTAMALMLRSIHIPARNVTGFVGGTYNRFGHYYAVREGDAHSWVEAYVDDASHPGWQTFDPTPPSGAQPLESTSGPFAYIRDLLEALSQRWNKYVLGYDLRAQVKLFEQIGKGYDNFRAKAGLDKGFLGAITQGPVLAGVVIALLVTGFVMWRRRGRRAKTKRADAEKKAPDAKLESAAALYRNLENALSIQGLSRPPSLPPLRHAEEIRARNHALSGEVIALTQLYLETRFGGVALTDAMKKEFERRVRDIRAYRPPPAPPTRPSPAAPG